MWRAHDIGSVMVHFAGSLTAVTAVTLLAIFETWIVYTILIMIAVWMSVIGLQVWYELTRIHRVKGKGLSEAP